MNIKENLKPVTLFTSANSYEINQSQVQIQGYKNIKTIHYTLQDIDFSKNVTLHAGAKDFLSNDFWKEDFISGRIKL